jgi:hypothetical protein
MLSVKKEFIKAIVCFIKGAIEQDLGSPLIFLDPVTHVQPVNGDKPQHKN